MILYAPNSYKELDPDKKSSICNGCGPQGKFDFVPDTIWFLSIAEACNIHDYMYHIAEPIIEDKKKADRVFLNNMLRIIEGRTKWRWLKILRRRRAYKYYLVVKHFGSPAFWKDKNTEDNKVSIT